MQPAAKFRVQITLDGFPCELEFEGKADALKGIIEQLKSIGAVPPANVAWPASTPLVFVVPVYPASRGTTGL